MIVWQRPRGYVGYYFQLGSLESKGALFCILYLVFVVGFLAMTNICCVPPVCSDMLPD